MVDRPSGIKPRAFRLLQDDEASIPTLQELSNRVCLAERGRRPQVDGHAALAAEFARRLWLAEKRGVAAAGYLALAACPGGDEGTCGERRRCATHRFLDVVAARDDLCVRCLDLDVRGIADGEVAGLDCVLADEAVWVAELAAR